MNCRAVPQTRLLADIVKLAQQLDITQRGGRSNSSLPAYLLNMAIRLMAMRRVLADTGSIYLHCDPTASHYLKLVMDAIFGQQNFRNEIIWWYYNIAVTSKRFFGRKHDIILFYTMSHMWESKKWTFNPNEVRVPYVPNSNWVKNSESYGDERYRPNSSGRLAPDVFYIPTINNMASERRGYPTQKPIALLERILSASSNENDLVLDPFCGCGTAVHAAEKLGRRWVGIDISTFAVGLMRGRILENFEQLTTDDVLVRGVPVNVDDAKGLAERDKFEFEKWVCGAIGAEGMFHEPGTRGADGGVDGVLKIFPFRVGDRMKAEFAIVQVKGGRVTPDSVKALKTTVDKYGATAGVMVCFNQYMRTVENQRVKETFRDDSGTYPIIQGFSIEDLLLDRRPDLPFYGYRPRQGRVVSQSELFAE